MAKSDNARLRVEIDIEIVAAALYHRADAAGIRITRPWVEAELDRLRSHSPQCRCALPCHLSHGVTGARVFDVARWWVVSTARTRRLAAR